MNIKKLILRREENLSAIAKIYCQIWKEPPWNEDFWTAEGVIKDLRKELAKINAILLYAVNKKQVIGFTWGYEINILDLSKISGVSSSIWEKKFKIKRSFYIDELGVDINHRRKNTGQKLTERLLEEVSNMGISYVILRTDVKALAARNLYQKLGFQELNVIDAKHANRTYWLNKLNGVKM